MTSDVPSRGSILRDVSATVFGEIVAQRSVAFAPLMTKSICVKIITASVMNGGSLWKFALMIPIGAMHAQSAVVFARLNQTRLTLVKTFTSTVLKIGWMIPNVPLTPIGGISAQRHVAFAWVAISQRQRRRQV